MKLKILTGSSVGTFSKANNGLALNFGRSGTDHCDTNCPMHPSQNIPGIYKCYAERVERRYDRKSLLNKLARNYKEDPKTLCDEATSFILYTKQDIKWFRFSAFGSVPNPETAKQNKGFIQSLKRLITTLNKMNIPIHFPIETKHKTDYYRSILRNMDVVVRESATSIDRFLNSKRAVAYIGGNREMSMIQRIAEARNIAKLRTIKSGRKCIVCPAVVVSFNRMLSVRRKQKIISENKAKCGNCVACAKNNVDIVYPIH